MFTGLVEEIGTVEAVAEREGARILTIAGERVMDDLGIDASVSVDGCCLTVVERTETTFTAVAVEETLMKTIVGVYTPGRRVNLERAMRLGDRLGGHLVLGHVDAVGEVVGVEERDSSWLFTVSYPERFERLVIPVGSIAINGVSLTVAAVEGARATVSIIPHTHTVTTFNALGAGDPVNIEFDMVGKYVLGWRG